MDFETEYGQVTAIHVVQYEAFFKNHWHPIARYDTAHGFFHQDLCTSRGSVKYRIAIHSLGQALTHAVQDLKENWLRYRRQFTGEQG
ncbi:MAG: hypothetical protein HYW07_22315 [Candidatus Latescibacteria bacterium]|nr:hypothetical protein [Candidatus Latescibacterota bacterium]